MAAFSLGVSLAVMIVVFFFSVNPLSFLLSVMALALKTPPLGGRGGEPGFPGSCVRRIAGRYACPAQGQVFCALCPFILEIYLLKPGFALLLHTPAQIATNALTGCSGLFFRYFPDLRLNRPTQGTQGLTRLWRFSHQFHLLQAFAACLSLQASTAGWIGRIV